jgi:hypothetical protein
MSEVSLSTASGSGRSSLCGKIHIMVKSGYGRGRLVHPCSLSVLLSTSLTCSSRYAWTASDALDGLTALDALGARVALGGGL